MSLRVNGDTVFSPLCMSKHPLPKCPADLNLLAYLQNWMRYGIGLPHVTALNSSLLGQESVLPLFED